MNSFGALAPFIIAALLAVAMLIPGLDAAQKAIEGLIEDRESATRESCYAIVERQKGSAKLSAFEIEDRQIECEARLNAELKKSYNPALFYICKTRQLVTLTDDNPNATSEAIETSAALPVYTEKCEKYDNSVSQATSTTGSN